MIKLEDSNLKGFSYSEKKDVALYCLAVDKLNNEIDNKDKIEIISLSNQKKVTKLDKKIIWYEIKKTELNNKKDIVTEATFYTSHFILLILYYEN